VVPKKAGWSEPAYIKVETLPIFCSSSKIWGSTTLGKEVAYTHTPHLWAESKLPKGLSKYFKTTTALNLDFLSDFLVWALKCGVALNTTFQVYSSLFSS
jgi:hypothetical protein